MAVSQFTFNIKSDTFQNCGFSEAEHGYATLLPDAEDEFPSPKPVRQSKVSKKMQGGSR